MTSDVGWSRECPLALVDLVATSAGRCFVGRKCVGQLCADLLWVHRASDGSARVRARKGILEPWRDAFRCVETEERLGRPDVVVAIGGR